MIRRWDNAALVHSGSYSFSVRCWCGGVSGQRQPRGTIDMPSRSGTRLCRILRLGPYQRRRTRHPAAQATPHRIEPKTIWLSSAPASFVRRYPPRRMAFAYWNSNMVHDPCNPVPLAYIPTGLTLRRHSATLRVIGHAKPALGLQSHVVTKIAPAYVGCDHRKADGHDSWRVNAVHFPAPVEVPATILLPQSRVTVAALSNVLPLVVDFAEPNTSIPVPMPDPSGTAFFLFAVFIAWTARRLNIRPAQNSFVWQAKMKPASRGRRRHRSKAIATFCAFQVLAP